MRGLLEKRTEAQLTQKAIAEKIGISQNYYCQLESGKRKSASLDVIKRIAKALDCKVDELIA